MFQHLKYLVWVFLQTKKIIKRIQSPSQEINTNTFLPSHLRVTQDSPASPMPSLRAVQTRVSGSIQPPRHVSLISISLEQSLSPSLMFATLTLLKITAQLLVKGISLWLDSNHAPPAVKAQKWGCARCSVCHQAVHTFIHPITDEVRWLSGKSDVFRHLHH